MASVSCCLLRLLPGHVCDCIFVHVDMLRMLASCASLDAGFQSHIKEEPGAEITHICKDDLAWHLGDLIDKKRLEDFLEALVDMRNLRAGWEACSDVKDDPTYGRTFMTEYGPDENWFQATSDREPLLPSSAGASSESAFKTKYGYVSDPSGDPSDTESRSSQSSKGEVGWSSDVLDRALDRSPSCEFFDVEAPLSPGQRGEGRESFRFLFPMANEGITAPSEQKSSEEEESSFPSHFPSISPVREQPRLRHEYHRLPSPSRTPVCAPRADCLSCKKCEVAVELEW
jgi:hypothetical protein